MSSLCCSETESVSAADYHSGSDDSEADSKVMHRAFSAADAAMLTTNGGYHNMSSSKRCAGFIDL
jgi:hypothetical protein